MDRNSKKDLVLIIVWPFLAALVVLGFSLSSFWACVLFFVIPSVYLAFRAPESVLKAVIFSFALIPIVMIVDFVGISSESWTEFTTIFTFKILGFYAVESLLYGFFYCFMAVIFYERFLDKPNANTMSARDREIEVPGRNVVYGFMLIITLVVAFVLSRFVGLQLWNISFYYFFVGFFVFCFPLLFFY